MSIVPYIADSAITAASSSYPWISKAAQLDAAFKEGARLYSKGKKMYQLGERVYKRAKRTASGFKKYEKPKQVPSQKANYTSKVKVARGGGKLAVSVKPGRRKKRVSKSEKINKRLKRLEKGQVSISRYHWQNVRPMSLSSIGCNTVTVGYTLNESRKPIFDIANFYESASTIESRLGAIRTDDGTTAANFGDPSRNPKIPINRTTHLRLKNSGLSAVVIKYVNYECKARTTKSVLQEISDFNGDHGFGTWSIQNGKAADATGSVVPRFMFHDAEFSRLEFMHHLSKTNSYKQIGTISKAILRPGDEVSLYAKQSHVYKCEEQDQDSHTYMPDLVFGVLISIEGEIMHDDTLVTQVGFSDFHVDVIQRDNMTANFDNGLGHNWIDSDAGDFAGSANGWTTAGPQVAIIGDDS